MQGGHGRSPGKPSPWAIWCPLRTRRVSACPGDVPERVTGVRASLRTHPATVFPEIARLSPFSVTASVDSLCGEALIASPAVGIGGCGQKLLRVSVRFPGPGCATPTFSTASTRTVPALRDAPSSGFRGGSSRRHDKPGVFPGPQTRHRSLVRSVPKERRFRDLSCSRSQ